VLDLLTDFVGELRTAGVPVSTVETMDAAAALCHTDLADRQALHNALAATLVKSARYLDAFDLAFGIFFGSRPPEPGSAAEAALEAADGAVIAAAMGTSGSAEGEGDAALLAEVLFRALRDGDRDLLAAVARRAVRLLSGIEAGRPLGASYYLYRVLRQLNAPHVRRRLTEATAGADSLSRRLVAEELAARFEEFRRALEAEILRLLVADRGPETVARVLRRPLVEDADLSAATTAELADIERALHPLARRLAVRLARRRRGGSGRLDVRRTMRAGLSTGGVPADPRFRRAHRSKPEIVLLCDVSGSVATFARFTLQIVYALTAQFARVQSFAFVDALDEVTGYFGPGTDFADGVRRMNAGARVVWLDGRSDYGRAFGQFVEGYLGRLSPRTTVIVTGDARSNYRDPNPAALHRIAQSSRALFWLNPERRRAWDTGDSILSTYRSVCDGVYEVRTLRQLAAFVEQVALPTTRVVRRLL
jgi:uncharacterized protein with von Willebrand factor type A (vWA) domain